MYTTPLRIASFYRFTEMHSKRKDQYITVDRFHSNGLKPAEIQDNANSRQLPLSSHVRSSCLRAGSIIHFVPKI